MQALAIWKCVQTAATFPLRRNERMPAFCTHFSGPKRTQVSNRQGAAARRDTTSGHIVRFPSPGAAALDQESLGE